MSGNPECHEAHKLIAKIANPLVAYAPVAMTDDYALRASRSIIGTQPSLINQLNVPMMSPMYSSRAQPELSEGFQPKTAAIYSPLTLSTGYNCQKCGYQ